MSGFLDVATVAGHALEDLGLLGGIGSFVVRRVGRMKPRVAWANPRMADFFLVAVIGSISLLAVSASWPILVRVALEGAAWLMCVRGNRFVAVPAVLAVVTVSLSGHAAAVQPTPAGAEFADIVHFLSAAMWAGGILALLTLRPPTDWSEPEATLMLERFGRVAGIAFGVTALTGLLSATEHLTALSDLWTTSYGIVLTLKAAGVVAMVGLSALWRRGRPVQAIDAPVVAGVVLATAVLAVMPPPA